ncbi:MAG: M42 family metallopeptidase [Oscillospiraceae bacterium]|jgi:endoglucanase|nr:M42 family metallopeptidase [Oscillospiraceae bacterium]
MLEMLKTLCRASGVSGDEDEVRGVIRSLASPHADDIRQDALGNLIVEKRGARRTGKKLMLCAHMDEVGVIVTHIDGGGYLKFAFAGGVDRRVALAKRVYFGRDRVPGVVGVKPYHMLKEAERDKLPELDTLYIDIGASSRGEAEALVRLGDTGAFDARIFEFGDGYIKAKAIDDRLGCAVMLALLRETPPVDCVFAFTVQEEVGTRGAAAAAFSVRPDIALIIEATTAADIPGVQEGKRVCSLGGGAVSPFMDGGAVYDRALWEKIKAIAAREGIPWQTKTYISGGTDAGAIQRSAGGVRVAALSAPVRNLHSPSCVGKISDFDAVLSLARAFLADMGESAL